MVSRNLKLFVSALACFAFVLVSACSTNSPEENQAAACSAYESFVGALNGAQEAMNSSTTVGEVRAARDTLASSYNSLADAMGNVAEDRQGEVDEAWKKFDSAVSDLSEDQAASDAVQSLSDEFASVANAQESALASLKCE